MTGALAQCVGVSRRFGNFTAVDGVDLARGGRGGRPAGRERRREDDPHSDAPGAAGDLRRAGAPLRGAAVPPDPPASVMCRRPSGCTTTSPRPRIWPSRRRSSARSRGRAAARSWRRALPESLRPYRRTGGTLPLGVQRSAAFAQALAHEPDLLILDEPTSGVDPLARARLWETVAMPPRPGPGCWSRPTTWTRRGSATG